MQRRTLIKQLSARNFLFLFLAIAAIITLARPANAQESQSRYLPEWSSLDQRATPSWFTDAKFGIFIHWGLYSVPSFTNKGTYAEWYWHALNADTSTFSEKQIKRHQAITEFHEKQFGPDFEYPDFRSGFTGEFFDPDQWADLFRRSGARYVVLTSKHHDGYCLWPNKEASRSFGMKWNSVESGPHRDLVGELSEAVRSRGLKMGLYYSLWDWFNPYWTEEQQLALRYGNKKGNPGEESKESLNRYIRDVMYPQFKELVVEYEPALIFADGDWWMDDDLWQTKPLLAWLFNNAPNRDEVVINDRWGKVRGEHGGYYTTEYGSGFDGVEVPWEENRGMWMSFGYNRIEDIDDYRSEQELIYMLVDLVSRGGNLLLNIGPTSDGRIPVIMQHRLIQLGSWLNVNGEAIYGTRPWKKAAQWSDGRIPTFTKSDYHTGFPIFEMTISPKEGNAVKDLYFTRNGRTLYAFSPKWPTSGKVFIEDVAATDKTRVSLLGRSREVPHKIKKGGIELDISHIGINDVSVQHMYTFRIVDVE